MALRDKSREKLRKTVLTAMFCALAFAFSYFEYLLPVTNLIPLPGVKLGLANVAVILAFDSISKKAGICVAFMKVLLSSLLFGNLISFYIATVGTAFAYIALLISKKIFGDKISFVGASLLSAAAHSCGQIITVYLIIGNNGKILSKYLPVLLLASSVFGFITGILMNYAAPVCRRGCEGKLRNA